MPFEEADRLVRDDRARGWLLESGLPEDEQTREVLSCLTSARALDPVRWGDDVDMAIGAAYFYRAPEVESLESYDEIPGELSSLTMRILEGYRKKDAMEEHCRSTEEIFGACALNLAVRWSNGERGYDWCFEAVRKACGTGSDMAPRQWSNLRRAEREVRG